MPHGSNHHDADDGVISRRHDNGESESSLQGDFSEIDLGSIIDVDEIQAIIDSFVSLTGMGMALLDMKGEVLVSAGWHAICADFHRVHPVTARNCTESDLYLTQGLEFGEYRDYKCKNGLWDVVTPLNVADHHIGNIFTGQFFYDGDEVDEEVFVEQAKSCGFDKENYLAALRRVPVYSRDEIDRLMDFLVRFTAHISKLGATNIHLAREISRRTQAEEMLRENAAHLGTLIETIPDLVWLKDPDGVYLRCNPKFERFFGAKESEIVGRTDHDFVDKELADFFRENDQLAMARGKPSVNEEEIIYADDGHTEILETIKTPMFDSQGKLVGILGIGRDITKRKRDEQELAKHRGHLEDQVLERTEELRKAVNIMAGRENRMADLKEVIRKLQSQLKQAGLTPED